MEREKRLQALISYIVAAIVIPAGIIVSKRAHQAQLKIIAFSCFLVVVSQIGWCLSCTFNVLILTK